MINGQCLVYIVDDDPRICAALTDLLDASGIPSRSFKSISEYLSFERPQAPGCLLLDIDLPDISGLEFQAQIDRQDHPPIVFVTGQGDIPSSVLAMKQGAVDFLTKPFQHSELMSAVQVAIDQHRVQRSQQAELADLRQRLATLTPREREVLPLVASGLLNKQAAARLGISEVTLQIHRGKLMHKMKAASVAELVRFAEKLRIPMPDTRRHKS
jgi:FixJ family two-component response regulator